MREAGFFGSTQGANPGSGWFLRWGTYTVIIFFFTILILSGIFSYNDVIWGRITITSANPPVQVQAKQTGRLSEFNFNIGDQVSKGAVLAVIENPANQEDIEYLKVRLLSDSSFLKTVEELRSNYPPHLNLGTIIQPYYRNFLGLHQEQIMDGNLRDDELLQEQVRMELNAYRILLEGKGEQVDWAKRNTGLVAANQLRNQRLFEKGVISKRDFEAAEKELNEEQLKMQVVMNEYNDLLARGQDLKRKEIQIGNQIIRSTDFKKTDLLLAHQELVNAIHSWEDEFLLKSPIDGKISYVYEWAKIYSVSTGEIVFTVTPHEEQQLVGKAVVPGENSGKMKIGQKAVFRLDHYPPREWGTVNATVRNFAQIPTKAGESVNLVYFDIPELKTSYGKDLEYKQDLLGSVEIILEEVTLLERVFYQFRHLWSNNEIF